MLVFHRGVYRSLAKTVEQVSEIDILLRDALGIVSSEVDGDRL